MILSSCVFQVVNTLKKYIAVFKVCLITEIQIEKDLFFNFIRGNMVF